VGNYCEYCKIHQDALPFLRFHIEHVLPHQHGGQDEPNNLALACGSCNRRKGPNLSALDPATGRLVALFNPRTAIWSDHFEVVPDGDVHGTSEVGRATVRLLQMSETSRKLARAAR
jgi:hypothetical protein